MAAQLKDNLKTEKKTSSSAVRGQSFESAPQDKNLKIISVSNNKKEELFYSLNKNLFQLEKKLVYFNFALKEIKEIVKIS